MSGKSKYIFFPIISLAVFVLLGILFDRDLFRYPLIISGKGAERERAAILGTIHNYNAILTDIYVSGGIPALLNEFPATKSMRHGLFRDIGFIRDSGRVLVNDMADILPVEITITSPSAAEAVVFEEWNYLYQRSADRMPVSPMKGLGQGFRYQLIRQGGAWMISAWDPVEVGDPGQKGFTY